ncbi:hypothetical protein CDD83_7070 [Cordyceps sp. RAO-2017]|nr:hypothetical protein CDD83_7070 [Cordyceps sp. RAO-2017]
MLPELLVLALLSVSAGAAEERRLGAYVFHRHGDRTSKAWKPVNLTALGALQVHSSGAFYRDRYLTGPSPLGLSRDVAVPAQLAVSSPRDAVLHASALTFLQGLYPPQPALGAETLANGSRVEAPLGGYQYVPVEPVAAAAAAAAERPEDNAWLQGGTGCVNAEVSSNSYFASADYKRAYDGSLDFYQSLLPVVNGTYGPAAANFKNAYSIFDLVNVATIHNASIPSSSLLSGATRARLLELASEHEWNLAYNASEPVRAIAGAVLAGQVLEALQAVVEGKPSVPRLHAQFGAYGTFMAFFGLAQLPAASADFRGICDYASSMAFELVTTAPAGARPAADDVSVRFLFANGSAADAGLRPFPLFGQGSSVLKWRDFAAGMSALAVSDTPHWCALCGKTDGKCAAKGPDGDDTARAAAAGDGGGVSRPVAGVIGALVTLLVVLGIQAAAMLFGGLRLVSNSSLARARRADLAAEAGAAKS